MGEKPEARLLKTRAIVENLSKTRDGASRSSMTGNAGKVRTKRRLAFGWDSKPALAFPDWLAFGESIAPGSTSPIRLILGFKWAFRFCGHSKAF